MKTLLILGGSRRVVDDALAHLREQGCTVDGVTSDHDAVTALDTGRYDTVLIGGGIEEPARTKVKDSAQRNEVGVLEARRAGRDVRTFLRDVVIPALREPR
ncbi:glycosyltransferase family protein [Nocardia bovistercoris]|uniref:Uncharacterized protein n=1 Tax=Nocardia bovistercoris TaxID=2785916 RepID=A0A931IC19_9NOCA|nr:hypothetical protein [Nocardia bovistercoris]MBH0778872.1 hypothetical protein [Nocardia bovistercoris]